MTYAMIQLMMLSIFFIFVIVLSHITQISSFLYHGWNRFPSLTCMVERNVDDFDWSDMPGFEDNIPASKKKPAKKSDDTNYEVKSTQSTLPPAYKSKSPNPDWRSAMSRPPSMLPLTNKAVKRPPTVTETNEDDFDLDYDDFEQAMLEEEGGLMNSRGGLSKVSMLPAQVQGLESGEFIPKPLWDSVIDSDGKPWKYSRVQSAINDLVVIYSDPRRMNDEFRIILDEFKKIPSTSLKTSLIAINCDDANDIRKFLKKSQLSFPLLTDPARKVSLQFVFGVDE